jgi:hypothetical protein
MLKNLVELQLGDGRDVVRWQRLPGKFEEDAKVFGRNR